MLDCRFSIIFKLPGLAAEALIGFILWSAYKRRGDPDQGRRAFAAYGLSLCSILISGFHGNTDPLYWMLGLLAAYCLETRRATFLAGLALGAAINVKLIPLLLVVPLATCLRSCTELAKALAGGLVALIPFALIGLAFSAEGMESFRRNVFGYRSNLESWGIELFVRAGQNLTKRRAPGVSDVVRSLGDAYWVHGAVLVLLAVIAFASWQWRKRAPRMDGYELGAAAFSIFLLFGSGFGVQCVGSVVPWLLMVSLASDLRFTTASGLFIGMLYVHFLRVLWPAASDHSPYTIPFAFPGFVVWLILAVDWISLLRGRWRTPAGP